MDAIAAGVIRNRRISSLCPFVAERVIMLLNVGVPTSAIQLIVCVVPIDAFDRSDHLCEWLCWVGSEHDAALQSSGHSRLHGSADLVRKIGCDHEIALCSVLLRFENLSGRSDTVEDGSRGLIIKPAPSFFPRRAKL